MMRQEINVAINTPCSEKFTDFDKTESGGFCASCDKEVIDFTQKSDQEILTYFKTKNDNTCGHFYKNQLKTYAEPKDYSEKKKFNFVGALSFSIVTLFTTTAIVAQKCTPNTWIKVPIKNSKSNVLLKIQTLKGIIFTDDDQTPLPGVSVVLKNSVIGTETDFDGNFELQNIPQDTVISVYALGYKSQEIKVQQNQNFITIIMQEDTKVLGGLVTVGEVAIKKTYKTKRSFWQRIKSIF